MAVRKSSIKRKTTETNIKINFNIDGSGKGSINTQMPFLDHMLTLFTKHGLFDLNIDASGDLEVDYHHTVEDIGIVMGQAITKAVGEKKGIKRYGSAEIPMDETLASVSLDLSGRPYLVYNVSLPRKVRIKEFDPDLIEDFFQAIVNNSGVTLHINLQYGRNIHHIFEAIFKAFGRALDEATTIDSRISGVPSTKGKL
ncbi:MAG TPA: imidazoleglycerol-phosphate dehydratase HisB [Thermodesulfovibrionales bacterium]|nr:imidazoleglycerol-phosphate dehydratase HisB [Thermodesulfovibrionales bacterium]